MGSSARWVDVSLFGSFQRGQIISGENPLEEIWLRLEHVGTNERLRARSSGSASVDWEEHVRYATTRIHQAVEFTQAARASSPLTAPVSGYYAMLNLVRAAMAIRPEVLSTRGHGLHFEASDNLFDCAGVPTDRGTFVECLRCVGEAVPSGPVTLGRCLREIVEMGESVANSTTLESTLVVPVEIEVWRNGDVEAKFLKSVIDDSWESDDWERAFPRLLAAYPQKIEGTVVRARLSPDERGTDFASAFCEQFFLADLRRLQRAVWYAVKEVEGPSLPRMAPYFIAMFILSSICRYEPSRLRDELAFGSERQWLIRRFLAVADRYFPQLILSWLYGKPVLTVTS